MNPKRALIALLVANILIQTGSSVKERTMPRPSRYVAIGLVFIILFAISDAVPKAARTTVAFAGLFTLTVALRIAAGKPFGVSVGPGSKEGATGKAAGSGAGLAAKEALQYLKSQKNQRRADKNRNRTTGATGNTKETYANA